VQIKVIWNSAGLWVLLLAGNLQSLWNEARQDQGYYWWLIESCIHAFDWCPERPLITNKKLHTCFQLGTKINNLGWPWTATTQFFIIHAFLEPTTKIWMKVNPYYQRQRCSPMTVVSCNIRFMWIFTDITIRHIILHWQILKYLPFSFHFFRHSLWH